MRQHEPESTRNQDRMTAAAMFFTALALVSLGGEALAVTIFTPPAFSAVEGDHISIVGVSRCSSITLTQPGRPPKSVAVIDGWFHCRAELSYGFNELYISSTMGDSVWLATVRLPFLANLRRTKVRYPKYQFHGNDIGKACVECHELTPFTRADEPMPDSTCRSCHLPKSEWIQPHRPAANNECRTCHGDGPLPIASPSDSQNLCQSCHKGKIEEFNKAFVHGPVGAGSCLACHNPHGSGIEFSLRKPVQLLCGGCHEEIDRNSEGKHLHAPFRDGACNTCHDPHATNYAWGQTRRSNAICLPCHLIDDRNNWHSHPTTGRPRSDDGSVVVNAEGELECTSCHDPHYAVSTRLLRTNEPHTCRGCHDDK